VSNRSGEDSIPKLQPQAQRSNDVLLDGAAAPRAAIDAHSLRRCALSVEPSAPNQEVPTAKRPERIERIPRRNHHTVARAQVSLSDFVKGSRIVGNCFQGLKDGGQVSIPEVDAAPLWADKSTRSSSVGVERFLKEAFADVSNRRTTRRKRDKQRYELRKSHWFARVRSADTASC
jgi:hypothetical protein